MATAIAGTRKKPARWEGALAGLRPVALPRGRGFEPMLCTLIDEPFDDSNWTFEPKWDGLRVICRCDGGNVQLVSRRGNDQAMQFPEIVSALNAGVGGTAVVDGEIVCLDEQGHSSFRKLQQRFHVTDPATIERRQREFPSVLYLFDVLYFDRFDVPNGGAWLVVSTEVVDPTYLTTPFWTSTHFKRQTDASGWSPKPCAAR